MHELGITQSIVATVAEAAKGRRVLRVTLEVGRLAGVMPRAIAFCFEVVAQGTSVEGAKLEIVDVAGKARCRACGTEFPVDNLCTLCPCGSSEVALVSGEELKIKTMEVVEAA
jgi:hydrogenase nickel incorporation protein HypA/HybF